MDGAKAMEPEETNRVYEGENRDTVDGFRKFVKRQLHKMCIVPRKNDKKSSGAASLLDGTKHSKVARERDMDLSDVYDFSHRHRGLAVIINNEDFSLTRRNYARGPEFDDRFGSSCDASALSRTFENLGFNVLLEKNLEDWKMVQLLELVKGDYDHANADCFVCAILTHGEETLVSTGNNQPEVRLDMLFGTNGKSVATSTLVDMFSDNACPNLEGKPRLFFMQACRGEKYDDGTLLLLTKQKETTSKSDRQSHDGTDHGKTQTEANRPHDGEASSSSYSPRSQSLQTDTTDAIPDYSEDNIEEDLQDINLNATSSGGLDMTDGRGTPVRRVRLCPTPLYKDSLIMYATTPGYYAWRRDSGAWFVQTLCKVLDNPNIGSTSLLSALVKVVGIVARDFESKAESKPSMHQKKETPVIESMLVKDVFFSPK